MSRPRPPATKDSTRIIHLLSVATDSTTVAAVGPDRTFAYSDANWREIKQSLSWHDGIDADAVMVGDRWWAQSDPATAFTAPPQRPLREQLQELAADYRGLLRFRKERWALTPKQEADEIQKVLDAVEHARLTLNSSRVGFIFYGIRAAGLHGDEAGNLCKAMSAFTAKAERWRDRLKATGSRSNANARKVHIEYWGELVSLWQAIAGGQAPRALNHFLYVCSAPVFPETTKGRIRSFLNQLH
jgi:hypothetical protein